MKPRLDFYIPIVLVAQLLRQLHRPGDGSTESDGSERIAELAGAVSLTSSEPPFSATAVVVCGGACHRSCCRKGCPWFPACYSLHHHVLGNTEFASKS